MNSMNNVNKKLYIIYIYINRHIRIYVYMPNTCIILSRENSFTLYTLENLEEINNFYKKIEKLQKGYK